MLKMTILRHGKTPGNLEGRYVGTTDEGILESEIPMISSYRFDGYVDAVFVSPMKRCQETADILYPAQKKIVIPEFREIDFGRFEYKTYLELLGDPDYQAWIDSGGTTTFPDGESLNQFHARIQKGMEKVVHEAMKRGMKHIALVVHGGTIMSLLSRYAVPKKGYFQWQIKNGEGYTVRFKPETFLQGDCEMFVDEQLVPPLSLYLDMLAEEDMMF